ncbi:MAG TPA: hypothetical protein VH684_17625 [Xanthobacteraceae bacterium]|jgi:hypothetical protein
MDARVTSAFTRAFDALCPRMTESKTFNMSGIRFNLAQRAMKAVQGK